MLRGHSALGTQEPCLNEASFERIDRRAKLHHQIHIADSGWQKRKEATMTRRLFGAAALMLALLISNAAAAQTRNDIAPRAFASYPWWGFYQDPNRCMVWDGYRWLNMCWRSRTFVSPAWTRFHR